MSEATACFVHKKISVSVVWWTDAEGGAGGQGGQVGGCQYIPGRDGGGVDQGRSSGNGEESLGLKYHVRSVEEGGL